LKTQLRRRFENSQYNLGNPLWFSQIWELNFEFIQEFFPTFFLRTKVFFQSERNFFKKKLPSSSLERVWYAPGESGRWTLKNFHRSSKVLKELKWIVSWFSKEGGLIDRRNEKEVRKTELDWNSRGNAFEGNIKHMKKMLEEVYSKCKWFFLNIRSKKKQRKNHFKFRHNQ